MSPDDLIDMVPADVNDPRIRAAVDELRELIATRYPDATFQVYHGEDPEGIHLVPTVDVDDLDDVSAVYRSRLVDLIREGLPIFVFPDIPPHRITAYVQRQRERDEAERLATLTA